MKTIFKYKLETTGLQEIEIPEDAQVLSVQGQHGFLCLWAIVDPDKPKEKKRILLAGTGHPIPEDRNLKFIGTVQEFEGELIWHIFEEK